MKREILNVQEAFHLGKELPFSMVRTLSAVSLGKAPNEIPQDELIEVRFFDRLHEVRVFRKEGSLHAALLQQEEGDLSYTETFPLRNTELFGSRITVSYELDSDEDGQVFVADTRLVDWEEANERGESKGSL